MEEHEVGAVTRDAECSAAAGLPQGRSSPAGNFELGQSPMLNCKPPKGDNEGRPRFSRYFDQQRVGPIAADVLSAIIEGTGRFRHKQQLFHIDCRPAGR